MQRNLNSLEVILQHITHINIDCLLIPLKHHISLCNAYYQYHNDNQQGIHLNTIFLYQPEMLYSQVCNHLHLKKHINQQDIQCIYLNHYNNNHLYTYIHIFYHCSGKNWKDSQIYIYYSYQYSVGIHMNQYLFIQHHPSIYTVVVYNLFQYKHRIHQHMLMNQCLYNCNIYPNHISLTAMLRIFSHFNKCSHIQYDLYQYIYYIYYIHQCLPLSTHYFQCTFYMVILHYLNWYFSQYIQLYISYNFLLHQRHILYYKHKRHLLFILLLHHILIHLSCLYQYQN